MFAIIGMFVIGFWILRGLVNILTNIFLVSEQAQQRRVINAILSGKVQQTAVLCACCGQSKCLNL